MDTSCISAIVDSTGTRYEVKDAAARAAAQSVSMQLDAHLAKLDALSAITLFDDIGLPSTYDLADKVNLLISILKSILTLTT